MFLEECVGCSVEQVMSGSGGLSGGHSSCPEVR